MQSAKLVRLSLCIVDFVFIKAILKRQSKIISRKHIHISTTTAIELRRPTIAGQQHIKNANEYHPWHQGTYGIQQGRKIKLDSLTTLLITGKRPL